MARALCATMLVALVALAVAAGDVATRCRPDALALRHGLWPSDGGDALTGDSSAPTDVRGASSLAACCVACAAVPGCAAFAFRPRDGLCVLSQNADRPGAGIAAGPEWLAAPLAPAEDAAAAEDDSVACTGDDVARMSAPALLADLRGRVAKLTSDAAAFWARSGPDDAGGGFHTALDERGSPAPPFSKSARSQAEDLGAMSTAASAARSAGDASAAARSQALADSLLAFLLRAFRPAANGTSVPALTETIGGSAAATPLSTHLAVISALATYAKYAPDAAAAASALAAARAQADAADACCHDTSHGGYTPRWEISQGWFPAGAAFTVGMHTGALGAASSLRNATLARNFTPAAMAQPARVDELLRIIREHVVVTESSPAASADVATPSPFAAAFFRSDWTPQGPDAGGATHAEHAATLGLLAAFLGSARGQPAAQRPGVPPALLAAAAEAAEAGYDVVHGGFYEGSAAAAGTKTAWQQQSAALGLLWLWRLTGQRAALCRAAGTLRWLQSRQAAPAGEFFWTVDSAGVPVGTHGSLLAEPWKGAGMLGALAGLQLALNEVLPAEALAADAMPQHAAPAAVGAVAMPGNATLGSRNATCGAAVGADAVPFEAASELRKGGRVVDVRVAPSDAACCAACVANAHCVAFARRAADGLCILRRARGGMISAAAPTPARATPPAFAPAAPAAAASASRSSAPTSAPAWAFGAPARPPLVPQLLAACPAALPVLALDTPIPALAGQTGKAPGQARTPVRLALASCGAGGPLLVPSVEASAQLRGESSRRDYPKKQLSVKLERSSAHADALLRGLGLPDNVTSFILAAPFSDRTALRDALTWHVAAALDLPAPVATPLELRTGGGDPQGLYFAVQRPDDVAAAAAGGAGATVLSYDPWELAADAVFVPLPPQLTGRLRVIKMGGTAGAEDKKARLAALGALLRDVAASLHAGGGNATLPSCDWAAFGALADADSFVAAFVLTEWANDPDAYAKSTFLTVSGPGQGKLRAATPWDKNLAYGGSAASGTSSWRALAPCTGAGCDMLDNGGSIWGALAAGCPPFWAAAARVWRAARSAGTAPLSDAAVGGYLRDQAARLRGSGAVGRDRARWHGGADEAGYDADVAGLARWAAARAAGMDAQMAMPWPQVKDWRGEKSA